jgi:hypothetical protein
MGRRKRSEQMPPRKLPLDEGYRDSLFPLLVLISIITSILLIPLSLDQLRQLQLDLSGIQLPPRESLNTLEFRLVDFVLGRVWGGDAARDPGEGGDEGGLRGEGAREGSAELSSEVREAAELTIEADDSRGGESRG